MLAGHYGVGLAAKGVESRLSLGLLFVAVQLPDFLWTILNLAGIEHTEIQPGITAASPLNFAYYPYSHSLVAALVLSGIMYALVHAMSHARAALVVALAVFSHWVLDFLTHRPDLPLAGNESPKLGLGLWNYPLAAILVESLIVAAGLTYYLRRTRGSGFAGRYGMFILMAVVLLFTIMGTMSEPPPNVRTLAASGLIMYIAIALLGRWLDQKRTRISP